MICALALGLALTPAVQRWAVLRAARDMPGLKLELATVSAGFSGVTLTGVRAEPEGVPVQFDRLEADFSPLSLVFGDDLKISRLKITGLKVDASRLSRAQTEAAAAGAPAAAPGLLGQVELPFDLTLDGVTIEGRALVAGTIGQPPIEADFTLTGGQFAPGREGALELDANLRNPATGAKVSTLHAHATLRATLTPQRTFGKVSLTTVVDAAGPALSGQTQLKFGAELYGTTVGENYEITVSSLLQGSTENLLIVRALLPNGSREYKGEWDFKARTAQLEPFVLGGNLPDFDARGGGRFTFDPGVGNFGLQGALQGRVSRLELVEPAWRAFGSLNVDADFDLGQQGGVLDLRRLKATVAGAQPVMEIQTAAPIRFDLRKNELLTATGSLSDALLRVKLQGLPLDWIRPFITAADVSGAQITGQLELARASANATDATVRGQVGIAELNIVQEGRPLLTKAAITARLEATLAGGAVTAPVVELSVRTPAGDVLELAGRFASQAGAAAPMTLAARFNFSTAKLLERWLPGAPVTAEGGVDVTWRGEAVDVRPGRIAVRQGPGRALVEATVDQPFTFNLATHALQPQDASATVIRLALGRVPLSILPLTQPDAKIGGFLQQGDFTVSVPAGKIIVQALSPLVLADVSLTQNRQPALTGLSVAIQPQLEYAGPGSLKLQSGDVTIRAAKATLATLRLDATQVPGQDTQAVMNFALEVPVLAGQPLFAGAQAVSAGLATGEVRASIGPLSQLEARLTLNGLVSAETSQILPVANIGFRARIQPSGAASVQVPLLFDNSGRRSDLNFALELSPLGRGYSVDGRLTGEVVELEDLLAIMSVFSATAAPDSAEKPAPVVTVPPDQVAAWALFSGHLGLDIKSVTRGKDWAMTGLTGAVTVEPSLVTLQKLEAAFSETSRLAAKMELRFIGGAMPYRITGDYSLNDFDTGRLFKAIEPGKPPTVEGLFNISGRLAGNGETMSRAIDRLQGEFQLTSRQGIFRGLQRTSTKVSMTSKAVELGAGLLGSILGSEKAVKTAEKVAGQAYFVDQLAQGIGEFNYDLLSVRLSRDELLNMNLEDITLVSPEIRLNGRGSVSYVVGQPLLEQPLTASLSLAARGKVEQLMGKARLLDGTKDELGYTRAKERVTLGGTLAKPDPSAFFTKLATTKLVDFLDGGN